MPKPKAELESMPFPKKGVRYLGLTGAANICMRLSPTDRSWYFRGTLRKKDHAPEDVWMALGGVEEARWTHRVLQKEGIRLKEMCEAGVDPREPQPLPPAPPVKLTLGKLWEEFKAEHHPHLSKSYAQENEDRWRLHLHKLGDMAMADIDPEVIKQFLGDFKDRKTLSNHLHAQLSKMFSYAIYAHAKEGLRNPLEGRPKFKLPARERRLSNPELVLWATAWRDCTWTSKYAALWLLLTGARLGAISKYEKRFDRGTHLAFPEELQGVKGCRFVVMPTHARKALKKVPEDVPGYTVANCIDAIGVAAGLHPPQSKLTNKQRREREEAKTADRTWEPPQRITPQEWKDWEGPRISAHVLRKTFASVGAELGISRIHIQALISHSLGHIEDIYIIQEAEALLPSSQKIADRLLEVMGLKL